MRIKGHEKEQAAIERSMGTARTLKGQAAMEYLMTYGWAILVIVIVLAILAFYLPNLISTPDDCIFSQAGFMCNVQKPVLVADTDNNVNLLVRIDNQQGQSINVTRIRCTVQATGNIRKSDITLLSPSVPIGPGSSREFEVPCYDVSGTGRLQMAPNSNFRGNLIMYYNFQNELTGAPERLATATVTGVVSEG